MRNYNFDKDLIQVIQALYANSNSAVLRNNQLGELFRTTVGVCQGCQLLPVLFNIFLENIMQETFQDFNTTIYNCGRPIYNLCFADDINLMGGSENELQDLTTRLEEKARTYGMEVSSEKSKILVNSTVDSFKYLGSTLSKDGTSTNEIKIRIAVAMSAMPRLIIIWKSRDISFQTKLKLYRTLAVSTLHYGCASWTLTAETERRV